MGKSAQKNSPGNSPAKSSQFYTTKTPDNFLQRGWAKPFYKLSVLERSVPKTLAFAFGSRLRSKTQRSKTRVLERRFHNGKPQEVAIYGLAW